MPVAIRILVLSVVMSIYDIWAFRGVENNPVETIPAFLEVLATFLAPTALLVPAYAMTLGKGRTDLSRFALTCWMVTAALVALAWLGFYAWDKASGGYFRDHMLVGALLLAALMVAANFGLVRALDYLAPRKG